MEIRALQEWQRGACLSQFVPPLLEVQDVELTAVIAPDLRHAHGGVHPSLVDGEVADVDLENEVRGRVSSQVDALLTRDLLRVLDVIALVRLSAFGATIFA